ncbi:DMT family transporter [Lysobacter cavernae]|uniref:DMT family transporter n=1 Tax=Lysobacter cavernae TaxID=1685901 RepID=A0ABV7RWE3_9GAMM
MPAFPQRIRAAPPRHRNLVQDRAPRPVQHRRMWIGTFYALAAGLMWGLVFVSPLLLPEYPAALQSVGRYLAFGLIALPLAWLDRAALRRLTRADWIEALKLAVIGNLLYYLCLASAIQRAGAPVPTMIIGTLPVVIAVSANLRGAHHASIGRDGRLPWLRLLPSLLLIAAGIGCVNQVELTALRNDADAEPLRYAQGALLAVIAVACWTWYPLRNADWLRAHPERSPRTWATAQGVAILPLALLGYALLWGGMALTGSDFPMPLGPRPGFFVGLMVAIGLFASWLGTLCWNEASQRLPTALAGQLIVFETLAALAYAFVLRGRMPEPLTLLGIALLIAGVLWAVRIKPEPTASEGHAT